MKKILYGVMLFLGAAFSLHAADVGVEIDNWSKHGFNVPGYTISCVDEWYSSWSSSNPRVDIIEDSTGKLVFSLSVRMFDAIRKHLYCMQDSSQDNKERFVKIWHALERSKDILAQLPYGRIFAHIGEIMYSPYTTKWRDFLLYDDAENRYRAWEIALPQDIYGPKQIKTAQEAVLFVSTPDYADMMRQAIDAFNEFLKEIKFDVAAFKQQQEEKNAQSSIKKYVISALGIGGLGAIAFYLAHKAGWISLPWKWFTSANNNGQPQAPVTAPIVQNPVQVPSPAAQNPVPAPVVPVQSDQVEQPQVPQSQQPAQMPPQPQEQQIPESGAQQTAYEELMRIATEARNASGQGGNIVDSQPLLNCLDGLVQNNMLTEQEAASIRTFVNSTQYARVIKHCEQRIDQLRNPVLVPAPAPVAQPQAPQPDPAPQPQEQREEHDLADDAIVDQEIDPETAAALVAVAQQEQEELAHYAQEDMITIYGNLLAIAQRMKDGDINTSHATLSGYLDANLSALDAEIAGALRNAIDAKNYSLIVESCKLYLGMDE